MPHRGHTAQGVHLSRFSAGGEGHEKHRSESEILERNLTNEFVWGETQGRENQGKSKMEYVWGYLHP